MTTAENLFIIVISVIFLISVILIKKFPWKKLGFIPTSLLGGWWQILLFNVAIFIAVQINLLYDFIQLPPWMVDEDPLIGLFFICFLQELVFRGVAITWFERWGKHKAFWLSILVFMLLHLMAPYMWSVVGISFAGLTFIAGYFWGWHFLKFRNIYLLSVSHFLVNLSFNFLVFNLFK